MRKISSLLLLIIRLPSLASTQTKTVHRSQPLVFTHVGVIDGTGAPPKPDMNVVVTGERITKLGRSGDVIVPRGALES